MFRTKKPLGGEYVQPPFSGLALELVMAFCLPQDVARACMVCQVWRNDLQGKRSSKGGTKDYIWKQAVQNSHPNIMKVLSDAAAREDAKVESSKSSQSAAKEPFEYPRLAASLCGKRKTPELPKPNLKSEDLLVVVELKRKEKLISPDGEEREISESLGAFPINDCSPLWQEGLAYVDVDHPAVLEARNVLCPEAHEGEGSLLRWATEWRKFREKLEMKLASPGHLESWTSETSPIRLAPHTLLKDQRLTVSTFLFRRDSWRKFTLSEDVALDCYEFDQDDDSDYFCAVTTMFTSCGDTPRPFARNAAGAIARDVLESRGYDELVSDTWIKFKACLPNRGTEAEPTWLREVRKRNFTNVNWTDAEDSQVTKLKTIQFEVGSIAVDLRARDRESDEIVEGLESEETLLLLLEGLDWQ